MNTAQWGEWFTIILMAFALGLDAFSLGIGIGLRGIRLLDVLKLSVIIAIFHVVMPLIGIFTGHYVGELLGDVAASAGGALLVLLGAHMIYNSLQKNKSDTIHYRSTWGMMLFAFSVSIDSFSVGVSLGMFASDLILTVLLFGAFGGLMSICGLLLGRRVGEWVGSYGEAFGGLILLTFGLRFLF
ncbi:manganese efflux pump MntP [Gorillibacterium timonense]|uniref:manganese efflux pump MntP n=1 Tax=Gorillibacterium timonense TaxID=1689269 RepID=UPI00071D1C81|nr:manganese efflux pump MntP family protein [Gorillibacterium timonense]